MANRREVPGIRKYDDPAGGWGALKKITAIEYEIAPGSVAAYYPEANKLVPLDYIDEDSGTPSYKSVPVRVVGSEVTSWQAIPTTRKHGSCPASGAAAARPCPRATALR